VRREEWDDRYRGSELVWSARPNRFLVAETETLTPGRALDLACGEGRNAVWLAERGWEATGVDFSGVAIEKARGLARERSVDADWIEADLLEYEPPAAAFDLVILFYVHLIGPELARVLGRAAAAVAPGGTLLLVGHDSSNLEHGYGGPQDPAVLYAPGDVTPHLDGFEIERADTVVRTVDTAEGAREALDVLVRARAYPTG
jgi:SAM-dependent methyltransferase